ncbi:MAG: alpha-E domain-containing protein [Verrucomicrobia bacterium]|nr:alpha-E domain-containing protein [Verrucomicrobiota bacterium]
MLSRVAESTYWMSRYLERADNVARFLDVNFLLMLDLPSGMAVQWEALVRITGDYEPFIKRYGNATPETVIQFLTFDTENANSILSCVRAARENARSVRESISAEMWEQVNRIYFRVNDAATRHLGSPEAFFEEVRLASHLFMGLTDATMSHNEPWHFARLGRMIERADKTSRILDVKYFILLPSVTDVGTPLDEIQWTAVLRSASALQVYRQQYGRISPARVIEFLVLDPEFPRAMHFCLRRADESLHAISGTPLGSFRNAAEQRLGQLRAELDFTRVADIMREGLHEFIDGFQIKLNAIGTAISETFFAPRPIDRSQAQNISATIERGR